MTKARRRTDWVYRSNAYGIGAAPFNLDTMGTYEHSVRALTTGQADAQALWLVDSQNHYLSTASVSTTLVTVQSSAARPEPRRTKVLFVEGHIYFEPTTWAVGNLMAMGARIMVAEQDISGGRASVDADYTMWSNALVGVGRGSAAIYANDKALNLWERRQYKAFATNDQSIMVMHVRAKVNWTLQAHHGLVLWLEGESTGVNVRYQTWLRTLVERP